MAAPSISSQYRTLTHLYRFEMQNKTDVILKIYDHFSTYLGEKKLSYAELGSSNIQVVLNDAAGLLKLLIQKQLLPAHVFPPEPTLEDCIKDVKAVIGEAKIGNLMPIPTFVFFEEDNCELAHQNLTKAEEYNKIGEYQNAFDAYTTAFRYTRNWADYQIVPIVLEMDGLENEARLAFLHLVQYQLDDNKVGEALKTLEECRKRHPGFLQVIPLFIKLCQLNKQPQRAINFSLEEGPLLVQNQRQNAILVYKHLLARDLYDFQVYRNLVDLLEDTSEKVHILLKGARHALQKREYKRVNDFCNEIGQACGNSGLDQPEDPFDENTFFEAILRTKMEIKLSQAEEAYLQTLKGMDMEVLPPPPKDRTGSNKTSASTETSSKGGAFQWVRKVVQSLKVNK